MKNKTTKEERKNIAVKLGSAGGKSTFKKYGKDHMSKLGTMGKRGTSNINIKKKNNGK